MQTFVHVEKYSILAHVEFVLQIGQTLFMIFCYSGIIYVLFKRGKPKVVEFLLEPMCSTIRSFMQPAGNAWTGTLSASHIFLS